MPQPHELLDDGFAAPACDVLVVGCGNMLRGDDAVGPQLVRELWNRGLPAGVRCVDGGTAGMDIAFQMRGARRVVIVDASATGSRPGTLFRVPAEQVQAPRDLNGLHTHSFRWDHALAFSEWMLGPQRPNDITVLLIEAQSLEPGEELSTPVREAMMAAADLIVADYWPTPHGAATTPGEVAR